MQPFKRQKKTVPLSALAMRGGLILVGVIVLFFIIRAVVANSNVPALQADEIRQEFSSKHSLVAKVNELENTIGTYQELIKEADMVKKENGELKAELGRAVGGKGVLARVLTTPERNFYDTMIIDAGSDENIMEGQIAYAFDSVALGTITNVEKHRSTVQLFSAPDRETAGTAEGSDVAITLIGRGAGEYEVRMPRDVHFSVGELVSLQTVSTAVLAKIEKIVTDPRDPFQRLLAKAPVNLTALKFVVVK
jgi:cell shape-determining protein MreC